MKERNVVLKLRIHIFLIFITVAREAAAHACCHLKMYDILKDWQLSDRF